MKTTLISLVAMMGLFATTGCMAPTEAEEIGDEAAEADSLGQSQAAITQLPGEQDLACPPAGMCEKASDLCEPGDPTREYWCDILGECLDCAIGASGPQQ